MQRHRRHGLWLSFALHRLSGLGLAFFLPLHFLMLSQALGGAEALDTALRWTDNPLFKLAEWGLVFLLSVHLFGGLRLIALEWLPWTPGQRSLAAAAVAAAFALSTGFVLTAVVT
ncbi:MAG: succinate dehydrogenase, cytochrome b556 subunit [Ahrensia sp.]|nr:succinate dehydrogenase, cytochrome b556 subunit [Ahrensia sp.]